MADRDVLRVEPRERGDAWGDSDVFDSEDQKGEHE
jgi:hypothetical protein